MQEGLVRNRGTLIIAGIAAVIILLFGYLFIRPDASIVSAPSAAEVEVRLGEDDAANQMVVYLDPLCDRCHQFTSDVITELQSNEVSDGNLRISIRPLTTFSDHSSDVSEIALCANRQGEFIKTSVALGDRLFDGEPEETYSRTINLLRETPTEEIANEVGIDADELTDCLNDNDFALRLADQNDTSEAAGIYSTPTIFINDNEPIRGYSQLGYIRSQLD